ncbi:MAG: biotin synthase BioB [Alphaproteobacteria bacterium]|jgi:biotin synthase|nr:biotin synthase BioB [Alphaproteobacteria bacterium]MBT4082697.1 biotin synthase BioB [Alphaproteobacteria bacterium]MBT4543641.1 biotin synthase BioB [Alphaproteobacteria bacterium]MBT7744409.1 biotin synthase BioB [Alphaproteobacteria bacterium]
MSLVTEIDNFAATTNHPTPSSEIRFDWTRSEILELLDQSFSDLLFQAQSIHRKYFDPNKVQVSQLMSIKTGGCAEDCKYCPQSSHYSTGIDAEKLVATDAILGEATAARDGGASRFCMGAAWRDLKDRDMEAMVEIISGVKSLGMETCMTLGMLSDSQANTLAEAGLDYYNHNIDTSPEFYGNVITTRTFQERLDTLERVRDAGMKTCTGGIVGMGESRSDRAGMIEALATMPKHPESVPINLLIRIEGTPFEQNEDFDILEFVRTVAVTRITMPKSWVRLSAGRDSMSDEAQALCFLAGANSMFKGDKLLTANNVAEDKDKALLKRLGMEFS